MGKIQINFTNKWLYTFALIIGILVISIGVYAIAPNPGHSANELEGVCRTDKINCPSFQDDLGLYIDSNHQLCYPTSTSASCYIESVDCPFTTTITLTMDAGGPACETSLGANLCTSLCEETIACNGDSTQFSCGATTNFYYDQSSVVGCDGDLLTCYCSVSSGNQHDKEIPDASRCI